MSETQRKNSARFDPRWNFNNWAGGRWKCVDSKITLHSTFSHIAEYWGYVKVSSWPSLAGPRKFDANIYVAGWKIFLLTSKLEPNNVYYPRPGRWRHTQENIPQIYYKTNKNLLLLLGSFLRLSQDHNDNALLNVGWRQCWMLIWALMTPAT